MTTDEILAGGGSVPPPPLTVIELIDRLGRDAVDGAWLAASLETAPRLEAWVLSALRPACPDAISVAATMRRLGCDPVAERTLEVALLRHAVQLGALLTGERGRERWRHAMATAGAARQIAAARRSPDAPAPLAFAAGALRRVGVAALESFLGARDPSVAARVASGRMNIAQCEALFGIDTFHVSSSMLRGWGLPTAVCDAVAPTNGTPPSPIALVIREATLCAQAAGFPPDAWAQRGVNPSLAPQLTPTLDAASRQVDWSEKLLARGPAYQSSRSGATNGTFRDG